MTNNSTTTAEAPATIESSAAVLVPWRQRIVPITGTNSAPTNRS